MKDDNDKLVKAIDALSKDTSKLSIAARLRNLLPHIEAAIAIGHTRRDVYDALKKEGLAISFSTFATTLTRLRTQRGTSKMPPPQTVLLQPSQPSAASGKPNNPLTESKGFDWDASKHKPENLI